MERFYEREEDCDSSSEGSAKGGENMMEWKDSEGRNSNSLETSKRVETSCFRQYLSLMTVNQRGRIGSFQSLSGLGHGRPISPPSTVMEMSLDKRCKHPQIPMAPNPRLFQHAGTIISEKDGIYTFCNNPNCHETCTGTNGGFQEGNADMVHGQKRPLDSGSKEKEDVGCSLPKRKAASGSDEKSQV